MSHGKITLYQQYIQEILRGYSDEEEKPNGSQLIFDTQHNHYQLLALGWRDELKRILQIIAPVNITGNIIDGKIWVQSDFTEPSVVDGQGGAEQ